MHRPLRVSRSAWRQLLPPPPPSFWSIGPPRCSCRNNRQCAGTAKLTAPSAMPRTARAANAIFFMDSPSIPARWRLVCASLFGRLLTDGELQAVRNSGAEGFHTSFGASPDCHFVPIAAPARSEPRPAERPPGVVRLADRLWISCRAESCTRIVSSSHRVWALCV